jgi:hypothetical protein
MATRFSAKEIAELKAKNKVEKLYNITVEDKECIVKKPSRKAVQFAIAASNGGKDTIKMTEVLLNECWVAGDDCFKDDDAFFFAVGEKLGSLFETKQAEMGEL